MQTGDPIEAVEAALAIAAAGSGWQDGGEKDIKSASVWDT